MKSFGKSLLCFLTCFSFFGFTMPAKAVDQVSVAECTSYEHQWRSAVHVTLSQGFRPEVNRVTAIKFWLGGSGSMTWRIVALEEGNRVIAGNTFVYGGPNTYTITGDEPISVSPWDHYQLEMTAQADSHASWAYSSNANCYPITIARVNGVAEAGIADFNFVIYGYNAPEGADGQNNSGGNTSKTTPTPSKTAAKSLSSSSPSTDLTSGFSDTQESPDLTLYILWALLILMIILLVMLEIHRRQSKKLAKK